MGMGRLGPRGVLSCALPIRLSSQRADRLVRCVFYSSRFLHVVSASASRFFIGTMCRWKTGLSLSLLIGALHNFLLLVEEEGGGQACGW